MIEIGLGSVQSWECDTMGHLNVQHYVSRAGESLGGLALALGLGPSYLRARGLRLAVTDHHIRFLRELRPGAPFVFMGGVVEMADITLRLYQEMRNTLTSKVSAAFVTEAQLHDLKSGEPQLLLPDVRTKAEDLAVTLPEYAAPKGVTRDPVRPTPSWQEADQLGLVLIQQGAVTPGECDEHGFMASRAYMGRVSDGIANLFARTRGKDGARDENTGGAALEYRFVYRGYPRASDVLSLRSGVKALGSKTITWTHWLFDRETGHAVATAEAVGVHFDLTSRKSIELSAAARRAMERHLVPSLTV